jgi:hypothetical protein
MKNIPARWRIIEATAALLAEDAGLTNVELLQRLAQQLGASTVSGIPVNRFRRTIREPAQEFLRTGLHPRVREGTAPEPSAGDRKSAAPVGSPDVRPAAEEPLAEEAVGRTRTSRTPVDKRSRPHRSGRGDDLRLAQMDEAILDAFTLGLEADSRSAAVEAYRHLIKVRERVARLASRKP